MKKTIGIAIFIVTLALFIALDFKQWHKDLFINHYVESGIRVVCLIPCIYLLGVWYFSIPMLASWWWLIFDGVFNLLRGFGFFFRGSEDGKDDAIVDNILQAMPIWLGAILKILLVILFTFLYLRKCNHLKKRS